MKFKEIVEVEAQVRLHSHRIRAMVNGSRIVGIEIIEKENSGASQMSWRSPNSQAELDRDMNRIGNWTLCIGLFSLALVPFSVELGG